MVKSRVDWIRTSDPLHPMQMRYRAAPPPEPTRKFLSCKRVANVTAFYKNQPIFAKFYFAHMKILLKQVIIADPRSPHNGTVKDILISEGRITKIAADIFVNAYI